MLLTREFWRAAGLRALYTLLAAALPLLAPVAADPTGPVLLEAGLALAGAVVLSLITSLANLPETHDGRPRWLAVLDRTVRSFFQVLAAAFVAGTVLTDVDWPTILVQAGVAAATTLLRTLLSYLPEEAGQVTVQRLSAAGRRPMPAFGLGARVLVDGSPGTITAVYADPSTAEAEYSFEADNGLFSGRFLESDISRPAG